MFRATDEWMTNFPFKDTLCTEYGRSVLRKRGVQGGQFFPFLNITRPCGLPQILFATTCISHHGARREPKAERYHAFRSPACAIKATVRTTVFGAERRLPGTAHAPRLKAAVGICLHHDRSVNLNASRDPNGTPLPQTRNRVGLNERMKATVVIIPAVAAPPCRD